MVSFLTWCRYFFLRLDYALTGIYRDVATSQIVKPHILGTFGSYLFRSRLTDFHFDKKEDIGGMLGGTLLVRKLPRVDNRRIRVGDVIVMRMSSDSVSRVAALGERLMICTDGSEDPFYLEKHHFWVITDNKKPEETLDSRTLGRLIINDKTIGRAIYWFRSSTDHGPVENSAESMKEDAALLEVELDLDELERYQKSITQPRPVRGYGRETEDD
ncbi:uncharacterized protein LOC127243058 [Andrographis paniculata]|uniref:uncharacterized protein LOC127243058 n=1 Tax=Andrographis paniculata TaxID=175694 RepID=UPI0021E90666|nr:uncharacterized protein LOC127243058 [Andrographis paniculata]